MRLKHPVVRGHPLHAMVSDLPVAFIPLALVTSVVARRHGSDGTARLAAAAALTAMTIGWWDWLTIPRSHPAWRPATIHGLINTSVTLGAMVATISPARRPAILGIATAGLTVAAWLGGDLVYALGWRVRPAEELEIIEAEAPATEIAPYRAIAKRKVDEHERSDTLLG
jgi:uncharacterized membrane protein